MFFLILKLKANNEYLTRERNLKSQELFRAKITLLFLNKKAFFMAFPSIPITYNIIRKKLFQR